MTDNSILKIKKKAIVNFISYMLHKKYI